MARTNARLRSSAPSAARGLVILGTRPEAIKLAPVALALRAANHDVTVVSTGQHRDTVRELLAEFKIPLGVDLNIMRPNQSLDYVVSACVRAVGRTIDARSPDYIVVQGDTSSAFASSLAAFHRHVPVAHVEAGLRTRTLDLPFPEEYNRRAIALAATWHFAPTQMAVERLHEEALSGEIHLVGNTVVDSLRLILRSRPRPPSAVVGFVNGRRYIVATAHRRESWHGGIRDIALGVRKGLSADPDARLLFVAHPNPVVEAEVRDALRDDPRVLIVPPMGYRQLLATVRGAAFVLTDSGGLQEEAPTLGVPVLVARDITERPEGVLAGAVRLVGRTSIGIADAVAELLTEGHVLDQMSVRGRSLYGDGNAGTRISMVLDQRVHGLQREVGPFMPSSTGDTPRRRRALAPAPSE